MPFVEEISRDFSLRLGVGIDAVHVSNAVIDRGGLQTGAKLYLTHTTLEDIDGRIRQQREAYPEGNCLFNGWTEDFEGLYHTLFMDAQEEAPPPQDGRPQIPGPGSWSCSAASLAYQRKCLRRTTGIFLLPGSSSVFREWICSTCFWRWRS